MSSQTAQLHIELCIDCAYTIRISLITPNLPLHNSDKIVTFPPETEAVVPTLPTCPSYSPS